MTRKADTLRPFLRCAAVVLCSLALPLAVFALWDRALLAAPHTRTDDERFSAGGRANATACTLYAAEHVTKVSLSSNSVWDGGWTAGTMDGSALARARRTLRALHEAGLLCDDSFAAALSVCRPGSRKKSWWKPSTAFTATSSWTKCSRNCSKHENTANSPEKNMKKIQARLLGNLP